MKTFIGYLLLTCEALNDLLLSFSKGSEKYRLYLIVIRLRFCINKSIAVGVQYIESLRIDPLISHEILQALKYKSEISSISLSVTILFALRFSFF